MKCKDCANLLCRNRYRGPQGECIRFMYDDENDPDIRQIPLDEHGNIIDKH